MSVEDKVQSTECEGKGLIFDFPFDKLPSTGSGQAPCISLREKRAGQDLRRISIFEGAPVRKPDTRVSVLESYGV